MQCFLVYTAGRDSDVGKLRSATPTTGQREYHVDTATKQAEAVQHVNHSVPDLWLAMRGPQIHSVRCTKSGEGAGASITFPSKNYPRSEPDEARMGGERCKRISLAEDGSLMSANRQARL